MAAITFLVTSAAVAVLFPQGGRFGLALLPYMLLLAGPLLALWPRAPQGPAPSPRARRGGGGGAS